MPVEVIKEVPVPVERVVYKEVLVPVERMTAEARQEYNQYAATQGLPQYNSTMGFIVSLCVQLRCAKCRPHAPSHHDFGNGTCSKYPLLCLSNDHNIPLVPSISDSAPWTPLVRTQLVLQELRHGWLACGACKCTLHVSNCTHLQRKF